MRRTVLAFVFVSLPVATLLALGQPGAQAGDRTTTSASGLDVTSIDRAADACTDFYQFACGGWIAANPMPADRPRWGAFSKLSRSATTRSSGACSSRRRRERTDRSRRSATTTRAAWTSRRSNGRPGVRSSRSSDGSPACVARAICPARGRPAHSGVNVLFSFGAEADSKDASRMIAATGQGGLGLPDRDYYLRRPSRGRRTARQVRAARREHARRSPALARRTPPAPPRRSCASRPRSPRRRSTASRGATRTEHTIRCRRRSCRR